MDNWAKVFNVGERQVLFYYQYDPDEEIDILNQIYRSSDGISANVKLSYTKEGEVERIFDKVATQEGAERVVKIIEDMLNNK